MSEKAAIDRAIKNLKEAAVRDFGRHVLEYEEFPRILSFGSLVPKEGVSITGQIAAMELQTELGKWLTQKFQKKPEGKFLPKSLTTRTRARLQAAEIVVVTNGGWGDVACDYGHFYSMRLLVEFAMARGITVYNLEYENAVREKLEPLLAATSKVSAVSIMGHGDETRITGCRLNVLMDPSNYPMLRNRSGSYLSCLYGRASGQRLGSGAGELAEQSCTEEFVFNVTSNQPAQDTSAHWYFESFYEYDRSQCLGLLHGPSTVEAVKRWNDSIKRAGSLDKYYLQADLDAMQWPGLDDSGWGPGPVTMPDRIEVSVNGSVTWKKPYSGPGLYEGSLDPLPAEEYVLEFRKVIADQIVARATRQIFVVQAQSGIEVEAPTEGQTFTTADRIPLKCQVK
jgi:hypothetical protein